MRETEEVRITDEIVYLKDSYDSQEDMDIFTEQFDRALLDMARVYAAHREEKGDSWKDCEIEYLRCRLEEEYDEWTNSEGIDEAKEIADILNIGFMLLMKLQN